MMVEWWAYLLDVLTFYNERIANEDYLRTAMLPETPGGLIQLLGYRPRPAIGATGMLAALVAPSVLPGQTVTLPAGLQFQSKPGPGDKPQTFELSAATDIGLPDQVAAVPPPTLLQSLGGAGYTLLLQGRVTNVAQGSLLLLGLRDDTSSPALITVTAPPSVQTLAGGGKQTALTFKFYGAPVTGLTAENARLSRPNQTASLWTVNGSAIDSSGTVVQLASLARQIRPNDWVVFTVPGNALLVQVFNTADVLGDASTAGSPTTVSAGPPPNTRPVPIPVLHTQLTLKSSVSALLPPALSVTTLKAKSTLISSILTQARPAPSVSVLFGWVDVGTLVDQPPAPWDGVSQALQAVPPSQFASGAPRQVLLQDANGTGLAGSATAGGNGLTVVWPPYTKTPLSPPMQSPIDILYKLLAVTRGQTVKNEVLGSGDAGVAGQSFPLANSPVTYLAVGSSYKSTITLTVNGQPWTEVKSFFGQPANAQVFTTREDSNQITYVDFGDGVNGARVPTGTNNVVATYRYGAGAKSPAAGKLTVIAQSYPGLKSVLNPVAVSGGSDPDPPSMLKQFAPRSVLAFGRAVSVFDYQAIAEQAPGVSMASAVWSWDEANLRGAVVVYVAGEQNVAASVQTLLSASGDPNRPVTVLAATSLTVTLTMSLIVTAGMDTNAIIAAVQGVLGDPQTGLFSPAGIGIGQALFDSTIEAVCLKVSGVVAIQSSAFAISGVTDQSSLHLPGEGNYFSLDPGFTPTIGGYQ
jgi:hypothetical protein